MSFRGKTKPEVRLNDDGTLDEVVGKGQFHLEQMGKTGWWLLLGDVHVWLNSKSKITAHYEREHFKPDELLG